MIQFRAAYSRSVLLQLVLLSILLLLIILINLDFVADIYFKNQATRVGYVVNGSILVLFAVREVDVLDRGAREDPDPIPVFAPRPRDVRLEVRA